MPKSEKEKLRQYMKESMKSLAKNIKAKVTVSCIYKKEKELFWYIEDFPYRSNMRMVTIGIKPWHYDELISSIAYPGEARHIQDKLRWDGAYVAPSYIISEKAYVYPSDIATGEIDFGQIPAMCKTIFDESVYCLSEFCKIIDSEYGNLNEFHISRAEIDPLAAGLAYLDCKNYEQAIVHFQIAKQKGLSFNWLFGSLTRDLRDVLEDYCRAMLQGQVWTKELVADKK